jgi:hypothetical protein
LPGVKSVDFSMARNWAVGERYGLQFRAEFFNLFNHANLTGVDANLSFQNTRSDANFGRPQNPSFGRLTSDLGPRVVQFGFKFTY